MFFYFYFFKVRAVGWFLDVPVSCFLFLMVSMMLFVYFEESVIKPSREEVMLRKVTVR